MPILTARVTLSLLVNDMSETLAFYESLGFEISGRQAEGHGEWAEVRRDEIKLQFFTEPPIGIAEIPTASGTFYFHPDSVDDLAREWQGKVDFAWGPEDMPYGTHEFGISDPNGYYLAFTEPSSS